MRKVYGTVLMATVFFACKPGIPKNVLQPDEMAKVLFDIHVVDGYLNHQIVPDSTKKLAAQYYRGVYQKYGIDSAGYNRSLDYYYEHPDKMKVIYDTVGARLARERDKQQKALDKSRAKAALQSKSAKQDAAKKIADSIKMIQQKLKKADSLPQAKKADSLKKEIKKKKGSVKTTTYKQAK